MSEFKGSKGNWKVGKTGGCVVTDDLKGFCASTGHADVEFYGGALICESVYKLEDAKLIAAAPELLESFKALIEELRCGREPDYDDLTEYEKVINKATE